MAEIHFCLKGSGFLLLETAEEEFKAEAWQAGTITHIPAAWAHRVVNTGNDLLVFIGVYHISAGHNYDHIEKRGFAQLLIERDGQAEYIPNPHRLGGLNPA